MTIRPVVPDITTGDIGRSRAFYCDVLGFELGMDLGWVVTLVSPDNPTAQLTLVTEDQTADVVPDMTVEVQDVDQVHARVAASGHEIVYPLTDEPWGVRRLFVRDPNGQILNVMSHST